jgi:hypothetical protein
MPNIPDGSDRLREHTHPSQIRRLLQHLVGFAVAMTVGEIGLDRRRRRHEAAQGMEGYASRGLPNAAGL